MYLIYLLNEINRTWIQTQKSFISTFDCSCISVESLSLILNPQSLIRLRQLWISYNDYNSDMGTDHCILYRANYIWFPVIYIVLFHNRRLSVASKLYRKVESSVISINDIGSQICIKMSYTHLHLCNLSRYTFFKECVARTLQTHFKTWTLAHHAPKSLLSYFVFF